MFKKIFRWSLIILFLIFVVIQFYPKPAPNAGKAPFPNAIGQSYPIPPLASNALKRSCYDCHSNSTHYPWYASIQPVAYWLGDHISDGKRHLNFDEFLSYSASKQFHKLEEVQEQLEQGEMPLSSYTFIHRDAKLSESQTAALIAWSKDVRASMQKKYPADSLRRKR